MTKIVTQKTVRVYRYGLLRPTVNAALVNEQMLAGHRYRNFLTEIERARRAAVREVERTAGDVPALEKAYNDSDLAVCEAVKEVNLQRAITRKKAGLRELDAEVRRLKNLRADAYRSLRDTRRCIRTDPDIIARRDAIQERASVMTKAAREATTASWGTYLLSEARIQAARKMPLYDGTEPNDPRFARAQRDWKGDFNGQVQVQLQGGMPTEDAFGDDTQLRIDPVDPRAWDRVIGCSERQRLSRTKLWIRVGSDGPRKQPVWAVFPMVMHRPLPEGRIKCAVVNRKVAGLQLASKARSSAWEEWSVTITIEVSDEVRRPSGKGAVAIDIGWRLLGDGHVVSNADDLRVCSWVGEDGARGELRLSAYDIESIRRPDRIRSVRDTNFDTIREHLRSWMETATVPTWLKDATSYLPQWKAQTRMYALLREWQRFAGDEIIYTTLDAWAKRDHHLWQYESAQRKSVYRRRRDIYRNFAAMLSRRYHTVVLEGDDVKPVMDLNVFAVLPEVGSTEPTPAKKVRRDRCQAGNYELRSCLQLAFARTAVAPPRDSTRECHACGLVTKFDAAKHLTNTCACGATWDQDENAAENLLARHVRERGGDDDPTWIARTDRKENESECIEESKWTRARRMRAERDARMGTARKKPPNAAE